MTCGPRWRLVAIAAMLLPVFLGGCAHSPREGKASEEERAPACRRCRSNSHMVPIVYGYPSARTQEMARQGKAKLAGCVPSLFSPKWHCNACNRDQ